MADKLNPSDFSKEELEKCKADQRYFHNKYVQYPGKREISEAEWDEFKKTVEATRNCPLKLRKVYRDYPLTRDDIQES